FGFGQARVVRGDGALPTPEVAVAPDGHSGRDFCEPVDHLRDHEIAGVHDEIDPSKGVVDLRPKLLGGRRYVRVGDEANAHYSAFNFSIASLITFRVSSSTGG